MGQTQVPSPGGLDYHHFGVDVAGGVRAEGDYYGDSSAHFLVAPGASPAYTTYTSRGTTLAACTGYSIDAS